LDSISSSVPNGEGTSCWVAISGKYAYIGNNATSNISLYKIGHKGSLTLLAAAAATANKPNDIVVAGNGEDDDDGHGPSFLYVLESGSGSVGVWRINGDGSLTFVSAVGGLPADAGAQGLAGY
jgi:6-phosphogluconolactonase (cycloisomerase 2 family)